MEWDAWTSWHQYPNWGKDPQDGQGWWHQDPKWGGQEWWRKQDWWHQDPKWDDKEWWRHRDREAKYLRKVRLCDKFLGNYCEYGRDACRFAHRLSDLTVPNEGANGQRDWSGVWGGKGVDHWFCQDWRRPMVDQNFQWEVRKQSKDIPDWAYAYAIIHLNHKPTHGPKCEKDDWGMQAQLDRLRQSRGGFLPSFVPEDVPEWFYHRLKVAYCEVMASSRSSPSMQHSPNISAKETSPADSARRFHEAVLRGRTPSRGCQGNLRGRSTSPTMRSCPPCLRGLPLQSLQPSPGPRCSPEEVWGDSGATETSSKTSLEVNNLEETPNSAPEVSLTRLPPEASPKSSPLVQPLTVPPTSPKSSPEVPQASHKESQVVGQSETCPNSVPEVLPEIWPGVVQSVQSALQWIGVEPTPSVDSED